MFDSTCSVPSVKVSTLISLTFLLNFILETTIMTFFSGRAPDKVGSWKIIMELFSYFQQAYNVTPCYKCLSVRVIMMEHNIYLYGEILKMKPKLSLLLSLIWNTILTNLDTLTKYSHILLSVNNTNQMLTNLN